MVLIRIDDNINFIPHRFSDRGNHGYIVCAVRGEQTARRGICSYPVFVRAEYLVHRQARGFSNDIPKSYLEAPICSTAIAMPTRTDVT